jgi:hypothetical protein
MNRGIEQASGAYVLHLQSDDYLADRTVLEKALAFLEKHEEMDWIYGKARFVDEKNRLIKTTNNHWSGQISSSDILRRQILKYHNFICHQAVFIKKSVFEKYGKFDIDDNDASDYGYWLKIFRRTKWLYFPLIVCNFRCHENSSTTSMFNRENSILLMYRVQKKWLNKFEFYVLKPLVEIAISLLVTLRLQKNIYGKIRASRNI